MNDSIVEVKNLSKIYKNSIQRLEVLKGIDLNIRSGEFLGVQGPSGAGKSTLLHLLAGLDYPSGGEVFFAGQNLYRSLTENERACFRNRKIGFIFQFYHLLPGFSALENVLMPGILPSWKEKKKATAKAKALLERVGLSARLYHKPNQLSGGEQQRVAIARALVNSPLLLLCDEPTGNLDSENGQKILALLKQLNRENKVTVILVTHDKDIAKIAQRVVYLKDGLLVN